MHSLRFQWKTNNGTNVIQVILKRKEVKRKKVNINLGYSPKDNTKLVCANNNRWYSEKDFKQIYALDQTKINALLECITCTTSWKDIKDMYRSTGPFANEVIVEGMNSRVNLEGGLGRTLNPYPNVLFWSSFDNIESISP